MEFPGELRAIVYSTNAIESLNPRFGKAAVPRGHFPTDQAALTVLILTIHYNDRIEAVTE